MIITAHGGAEGTGRNSKAFFDAIINGEIIADVLEVDIWGSANLLYLSHSPALFKKQRLNLSYAFEVAKSKNMKVKT